MRRIIPLLILLPFAACSAIQVALNAPLIICLACPAEASATPGAPSATQAATATANPDEVPASTAPEEPTPSWSLAWQVSEASYPEQHYSLAITRPHLSPESAESAWINGEIDALVQANIADFEEMAAQGILDEQFPGHLWMGFSVPSRGSTGSTEITEGDENTESSAGAMREATPPVPQVVGVSDKPLPAALPASQALLERGRPVLSLLLGVSPYTGGAHPGFYHVPLTLDLASRERLELADLFLPGSDYLERLSELAIQQLSGREGVFAEALQLTPAPDGQGYAAGAGPHPDNYRVWALSPQGLWLVFDPYQVAPWAAGPQFVLIPYAQLADLLDPEGALGEEAREGGG